MDMPDVKLRLSDQLCFALYSATNAITRAYRPLLGAIGLTYPQYLVMLALWQYGAASIGDLARRLKLGPSAITPLVDQLEAAGMVVRARSGVDRRLVTVALTDSGRELEALTETAQAEVVCRTGFTERQLDAMRDELHRLTDRVAAANGLARDDGRI